MNENKGIKKKIIISLIIMLPVLITIILISIRHIISPTDEEIVNKVKDMKYYKGKVEFIIKNDKDINRESVEMYVAKDELAKLIFGEDRTKIYKDGSLFVKDNISNAEYKVDDKMDFLHSLAVIENILSYPIEENSIVCKQEEWGNGEYIQLQVKIESDLKHIDRAVVIIDKDKKQPIGSIVFDDEGNERIRIIYSQFEKLKELNTENI